MSVMRKRVVFVTCVLAKGGGTEKHLEEMIARLDFCQVEPVIMCFGPDLYTERLSAKRGLSVAIVSETRRNSFWRYWRSFFKVHPHVIVFVNGILGTFPWYAYVAAKCSGAKRVYAIEHLIPDPFTLPKASGGGPVDALRNLAGWRARHLWNYKAEGVLCDRVICVSQAISHRLISHYEFPEAKMAIVRNGVDLTRYSSRSRNGDGKRDEASSAQSAECRVLCVARLSVEKRIDILLEAMAKVLRKMPHCKCTIVGDGPLKESLVQKCEVLGLSGSVRFAGHVDEVRPYYESADIFVLSSAKEGLPLVLLEAMAYGVPCIATNVGGNAEVIDHGETGFIVDAGNAEQLAGAILELAANTDLRQRMGTQGKERVRQHFNVDHTMAKLSEIILN